MFAEPELIRVLPSLPRISLGGPWTRVLAYDLLRKAPPGGQPGDPPQPLWPGGPRLKGARFNPIGSFDSVYLASDAVTALEEVGAIFHHPSAPPFTLRTPPWTVFAVEGVVGEIVDLTDLEIQARLGTSSTELTGNWRYPQGLYTSGEGPLPPTQLLGRLAYESGRIGGFRYHSAKRTGEGIGLVVFSERLGPGNFLEVYDPEGWIRQRLP